MLASSDGHLSTDVTGLWEKGINKSAEACGVRCVIGYRPCVAHRLHKPSQTHKNRTFKQKRHSQYKRSPQAPI